MTNIELFDTYTGKIFGSLYKTFPTPRDLGASEFIDYAKIRNNEQHAAFIKRVEFILSTAQWLADSGYIRTNGRYEDRDALKNVVLTAQGMLALKSLPKSLRTGPSIGESLSKFSKEESKEVFRGLVTEALGIGAKLIGPTLGVTS
ncbi:hypothetical protein QCD79_01645 [Pseudomonas quasicaspiana]|nr:hypothetical protein [Pseudomonas quasicaspiana]